MENKQENLVLLKDDYQVLMAYLRGGITVPTYDRKNMFELEEELKKGVILEKEEFPKDAVRLNSIVKIRDKASGRMHEFVLVLPEKANLGEGKISIMAPIGTALIGYRQGNQVSWKVPGGKKVFTIEKVINAKA